ncbi:hypothetical protein ACN47E_005135 [Coniothyrium glycines]
MDTKTDAIMETANVPTITGLDQSSFQLRLQQRCNASTYKPLRIEVLAEKNANMTGDSSPSSTGSWENIPTPTAIPQPEASNLATGEGDRPQTARNSFHNEREFYLDFFKAVSDGNIAKVREKVEQGADLERKTNDGRTPLSIAIQKKQPSMVEWLLTQGASVHHGVDNRPPIVHAILTSERAPRLIQLLLNRGAHLAHFPDQRQMNALHWAAAFGMVDALNFLLDTGMYIEAICSAGRTPLVHAAEKGHLTCVKLLLAKGADLQARCDYGGSALLLAATGGHLDVVKYLIEQGSEVDDRDNVSFTPLAVASRTGKLDVVRFLLEKGADVNAISTQPAGCTPAMGAAVRGHKEVIQALLSGGADLSARDSLDDTVLDTALRNGHIETARYLLEVLGGPEYPTNTVALQLAIAASPGTTQALMVTASIMFRHIDPELAEQDSRAWLAWTIDQGGELVKPTALSNMLYVAICDGKYEVVQELLRLGADPNRHLPGDSIPLGLAVTADNPDIVQVLLDAGADPSRRSHGQAGFPLLLLKALRILEADVGNDTSVVDLLLASGKCRIMQGRDILETAMAYILNKKGSLGDGISEVIMFRMLESIPDINSDRADDGTTLIHIAVEYERADLLDILLLKGADINARDKNGQTPLLWACDGIPNMARLLLERGADPTIRNKYGETALHIAASTGDNSLIDLLLTHGLDINALDNNNITPLVCAITHLHEHAALHILSHNPKTNLTSLSTRRTALHIAANLDSPTTNMTAVVATLLTHPSPPINARDHLGLTPLAHASRSGSAPLISMLLTAGADPDLPSHAHARPLTIALTRSNDAAALALLHHGAEYLLPDNDNDGATPLHLAAEYHNARAAAHLLALGARVNAADHTRQTPLCVVQRPGIARLLLEHGADVQHRDARGWTAAHHKAADGNGEVLGLLVAAGADLEAATHEGWSVRDMVARMGDVRERKRLEEKMRVRKGERGEDGAEEEEQMVIVL